MWTINKLIKVIQFANRHIVARKLIKQNPLRSKASEWLGTMYLKYFASINSW